MDIELVPTYLRERILFEREERKKLIPLVDVPKDETSAKETPTPATDPNVDTLTIATSSASCDPLPVVVNVAQDGNINGQDDGQGHEDVGHGDGDNHEVVERPSSRIVAFDSSFDEEDSSLPVPLIPNPVVNTSSTGSSHNY